VALSLTLRAICCLATGGFPPIASTEKTAKILANSDFFKEYAMSRQITATEAKNRLGSYLRSVAEDNEEIVIENHGRPQAVLLPYGSYRQLVEERERKRRHEAVDRLIALANQVQKRNEDLSEEEANAIAQEIRDLAIEGAIERDKIHVVDDVVE
jgi:prevent-host-death family protein